MKFKKSNEKKKVSSSKEMNKNSSADTQKVTVLHDGTPFFIKEAYKALRTNIVFSLPSDGCKKIAITSALSGEGKSTNCLNLAISFAEMGSKTLIIDADLRRPNVAKLLNEKVSPGLSNILVGLTSLEDTLAHTKYENLDVIYSGDIPPNPTELLLSKKMEDVMNALTDKYEYIFIDCPPVNVVTDASIISKYVSGMIMVVRQGETVREEVLSAKKQLELSGAKIIGTILNASDELESKYGYNKKYYKYIGFGARKRNPYLEYANTENSTSGKEKQK